METCATDGNQGFPINITGALTAGDQNFRSIQGSSELIPSFAPRQVQRKIIRQNQNETGETQRCIIEESDQNTMLYQGKRFTLAQLQISAAQGGGTWPTTPQGTATACAAFTYSRFFTERDGPQIIVLIVPLYEKETMSDISIQTPKAVMYFEDAWNTTRGIAETTKPRIESVGELFNNMVSPAYVSYMTCIPVRTEAQVVNTLNVLCAYFPSGWVLPQTLIKSIGDYNYRDRSRYAPFYFPAAIRGSFPVAAREMPPANYNGWIQDINNWSANGITFSNTISVNAPEFTRRFLWIATGFAGGAASSNEKRLKTTIEYQCMPLDRVSDIDGKYVLLDPATGQRTLKDTLEGGDSAQKAELQMAMKQGDALKTFAIVIGVIAGIAVAFIGLSFASKYIMNRQNVAMAAAGAVTVAAATTNTQ